MLFDIRRLKPFLLIGLVAALPAFAWADDDDDDDDDHHHHSWSQTNKVKFATDGLPRGIRLTVRGRWTHNGGHTRDYSVRFNTPGPSPSVKPAKPNTPFTHEFPARVTKGSQVYELVSTSPASPFNTGDRGTSTTVTATYRLVNNCTPPTIECPGNITCEVDSGKCFARVDFAAKATGSPTPKITYKPHGPEKPFPQGVTTVTATATNEFGSASCSFTVTIGDSHNPILSGCPADIVLEAAAGASTAVATWTEPAVCDNCPGVSLVQTAGPASGSAFPVGVTTVTYTATDAAGNTATCSFTVTVNEADPECMAPSIACPGDIVEAIDDGQCFSSVSCSILTLGHPAPAITYSPQGPDQPFPRGTTIVTATATNACGTATCTFTVTVGDSESPVIVNTPANIDVNTAPGAQTAIVTWTEPTVTDNCEGVTIVRTAGPPPGSEFPIGTTAIVYTATDVEGHTAVSTFIIKVVATPAGDGDGNGDGDGDGDGTQDPPAPQEQPDSCTPDPEKLILDEALTLIFSAPICGNGCLAALPLGLMGFAGMRRRVRRGHRG